MSRRSAPAAADARDRHQVPAAKQAWAPRASQRACWRSRLPRKRRADPAAGGSPSIRACSSSANGARAGRVGAQLQRQLLELACSGSSWARRPLASAGFHRGEVALDRGGVVGHCRPFAAWSGCGGGGCRRRSRRGRAPSRSRSWTARPRTSGDQVALAAVERRCSAHGLAAQRQLGVVVGAERAGVLGLGLEAGAALAPAQLVERGVAGDPEQPRLAAAAPRPVGAAPAVGALEGLGAVTSSAAERSRSSEPRTRTRAGRSARTARRRPQYRVPVATGIRSASASFTPLLRPYVGFVTVGSDTLRSRGRRGDRQHP